MICFDSQCQQDFPVSSWMDNKLLAKLAVKKAYPWTPTTHGKMKVLIPSASKKMGEITTKNEGNVGSHGT